MSQLPEVRISVDKLVQLAELAKLDREPWVQDVLRAAVVSGNVALANDIGHILHISAIEEVLRGIPFRTATVTELLEHVDTEKAALLGIVLGTDTPFLYPFDWLNQHAYVGGASGTGKTNALYGIALQVMRHCPVWWFDRDKEDNRHLIRLRPDIQVFDAQNFIRNPLEVQPGVKPTHQITVFMNIFTKYNALLDGSYSMGSKAVYQLYEEHKVFEGSTDYPTLYDFLDKVKSYKVSRYSRDAGYQDSIVNRLESYLLETPEVYGYSRGFPIEELAQRSFVLEVKGLSERHSRCRLAWLLYDLFLWRIANSQRGNALRNLVVIDEGKSIAQPGYNANIGFVPLASILAQSRETGLGIILADQTAHLDESIFVQSRLKMCFRMGSGEDIERIRKTFALSREQAAHIPKLDTGQAIVRIPKVDPFLIKVPRVRLG